MLTESLSLKPTDFRQIRKYAVQYVYQQDVKQQLFLKESEFNHFLTQVEVNTDYHLFLRQLVDYVFTNHKKIDKLIESTAKNWKISRISKVDLAILRIASTELMERVGTDTEVILSESTALAQEFGSANSATFVNGILDTIAKTVRVNNL